MPTNIPFDLRFKLCDMIIERMLKLCEKDSWKQGFVQGAVFQIKNEYSEYDEGFVVRLGEIYNRLGVNESEKFVEFVK